MVESANRYVDGDRARRTPKAIANPCVDTDTKTPYSPCIDLSPMHGASTIPDSRMTAFRLVSRMLTRSYALPAFCALTLATLSACAPSARMGGVASNATPEAGTGNLRVYDTKAARFVPFSRLSQAMRGVDVVFLGEQHDDPGTHAAEIAVLAVLGEQRERVVLSLEMFERDVQPLLDRYLAGTVSEKDFLAGSRPWDRYTTDYRGMIELARIRGWPVVAANVPRRIASAVNKVGLSVLDTTNATERAYAAKENSCPKDAYYKKFVGEMTGHGANAGPQMSEASMDRIYQAQCVKDETMGESVAAALAKAGQGAVVLHVDGQFHSDGRMGTVERARRRAPSAKTLVLSAIPVADLAKANGAEYAERGDFVLFTRAPVK